MVGRFKKVGSKMVTYYLLTTYLPTYYGIYVNTYPPTYVIIIKR